MYFHYFSHTALQWYFVSKSGDHKGMGLFLDSFLHTLFFTDLFSYLKPLLHSITETLLLLFFFFSGIVNPPRLTWLCLTLHFHIRFGISLSISPTKSCWIFFGTAVHLCSHFAAFTLTQSINTWCIIPFK